MKGDARGGQKQRVQSTKVRREFDFKRSIWAFGLNGQEGEANLQVHCASQHTHSDMEGSRRLPTQIFQNSKCEHETAKSRKKILFLVSRQRGRAANSKNARLPEGGGSRGRKTALTPETHPCRVSPSPSSARRRLGADTGDEGGAAVENQILC